MSVNQNATSTDAFQLYVFYNIPSKGYRGKVLKIQLDTVLVTTADNLAVRAQTYYFMPPSERTIAGQEVSLWTSKPLYFYYNR